jgi:hypothetical protein
MRAVGGLTGIAVALVLAGCSGGSAGSAGSATTPPDTGAGTGTAGMTAEQVCALLTTAEIQTATGLTVGAGVPEGVNVPSCTWTADGGALSISWEETSSVGQIAPGEQGNDSLKLVPVSGVGDKAFFTELGTIGAALDFAKGSNALNVSFGMGASASLAQIEAAEKALALDALARM